MTMNVNSEGLLNHYKNCGIRVKTKKKEKRKNMIRLKRKTLQQNVEEKKQSLVVFFSCFSDDHHVVFVDLYDLGFDFGVGSMISASCCLDLSHDRDHVAPDHDLSDTCCLDLFLDYDHEFSPVI